MCSRGAGLGQGPQRAGELAGGGRQGREKAFEEEGERSKQWGSDTPPLPPAWPGAVPSFARASSCPG